MAVDRPGDKISNGRVDGLEVALEDKTKNGIVDQLVDSTEGEVTSSLESSLRYRQNNLV